MISEFIIIKLLLVENLVLNMSSEDLLISISTSAVNALAVILHRTLVKITNIVSQTLSNKIT